MTAETVVERLGHPGQVGIRVAPGSPAAARVEALLETPLPGPNTAAAGILWLGPDEWLVVDRDVPEAALRESLAGEGAAVELSANRLALAVRGPAARSTSTPAPSASGAACRRWWRAWPRSSS